MGEPLYPQRQRLLRRAGRGRGRPIAVSPGRPQQRRKRIIKR
jgi:hypothetical protein